MIAEPLLVADCVGKRFGRRWVLRSASLRAEPGVFRAFVGRNGVGKSTLLKIGAGVLAPDTGVVRFGGRAYESARHARLAREGLFFLPDHDLLSNAFTVREQLDFVRARVDVDGIERVSSRLGLTDLLDARPFELSSGERRRAEVALALLRQPRCLLADEPLRNIAPLDAEVVLGVLASMASGGCAVVATGHEISALFGVANHVTWCTEGTTYELGPPFMARTDERFMRLFLGTA